MELTTVGPSSSIPAAVSAAPAPSSSHDINSLFAAAVAAAAANSSTNPESMAQSPTGRCLFVGLGGGVGGGEKKLILPNIWHQI